MNEMQITKNINRMSCFENSLSLFRGLPKYSVFLVCAISLTACQYYADPIRQQNLCKDLSRHYTFQQKSATALSPAQYYLCGDNCYPCRAYSAWGTPPNSYVPSHHHRHHRIKSKVLKKEKAISETKATKNLNAINKITEITEINKTIQSRKPNQPIKNNPIDRDIFLSPLKHSGEYDLSK